jgi:hypothetical protein
MAGGCRAQLLIRDNWVRSAKPYDKSRVARQGSGKFPPRGRYAYRHAPTRRHFFRRREFGFAIIAQVSWAQAAQDSASNNQKIAWRA